MQMQKTIRDKKKIELQCVQLELLKKFDEICNQYGLRYYIAYGTCLGAVRHKGFIPWDHDVDTLMSVENVKKLVSLQKQGKIEKRYFVQSKETSPDFRGINCTFCDSETTCITKGNKGSNINHGICIDIYPFYNCPTSKVGLLVNIWRSHLYRILVGGILPINHGIMVKIFAKIILTIYKGKYRNKKIKKLEERLCNVKEGTEILDYFGEDISFCSAITYRKEWFGIPRKMEFEGMLFPGPSQAEKYLSKRYGDFMKLPDKSIQEAPLEYIFVDTQKSYREYRDKWS